MNKRPPLWGNFVGHADWDLLSFAWLYHGGLLDASYYHAAQALEKYLKALALSIVDPDGQTQTVLNNPWLRTHKLEALAGRCAHRFPYYGQSNVRANLRLFTEFDQVARYPWVERKHSSGYTGDEIPVFGELVRQLRTDLPITLDDYILGMLIRGHHQGHPGARAVGELYTIFGQSAAALRRIFPDVDRFVRW
jgi:HEPN domain-containing protein